MTFHFIERDEEDTVQLNGRYSLDLSNKNKERIFTSTFPENKQGKSFKNNKDRL